ncbi:MAG: hypothetical protein WA941_08820, partial [Nitrososphaeraceae archaeon]
QQVRAKHHSEKQQLQREKQQLHEEFDRELQNRVKRGVQCKIDDIRSEEQEKHQQEIRKKNEVIELLKLQNEQTKSEAVAQALRRRDDEWRQQEKQYQKQIERVEKHNRELQNTLDSIPPERKGTAGEGILTEDLHKAFPQDVLVEKRVGEEMPDIIQIIVTENQEKIATPILWDMKTGHIGSKDIEKAHRYKEKYNSDYCILVTSRPIAAKDSKSGTEGYIGKRDGITLLHKPVAVEIAEEIRNFIIKETRLVRNNNGRTSKQSRLYDYITSPERFRKIQKKIQNKLELEELIGSQQVYNTKAWKKQIEIIKNLFDLDSDDQKRISDITQQDQDNEEDRPKKDEEDR